MLAQRTPEELAPGLERLRSDLESGAWARIVDVPARATNHVESVVHTNAGFGPHFYRLVTPAGL